MSLTSLNAVGVLLAAKSSPYQLLSGDNVSHAFVVPTVASSVDLVVHTTTDGLGSFGERHHPDHTSDRVAFLATLVGEQPR